MARKSQARELCEKFPDTPTRTLAKRLAREQQITLEQARTKIRYVRGNSGNRHRKLLADKSLIREPGRPGSPAMPKSQQVAWEPLVLGAGKTLSLSDIHVPYHDESALSAAVKWGKRRKPDTLLLNGDAFDFYSISRWQKDPGKRDFKAEVSQCKQLLEWLRSQFPKARIVFKVGNHEERWQHWLWNHAPEICDFPQLSLEEIVEMKQLGIECVEGGRPVMAGRLPIFHGHELPKGLTNPVNMARGAFLRMVDSVLVGHGHRSSSHTEPNWAHKEITTWSQGCLCGLYPDYARINKWNHGFAWVQHQEYDSEAKSGDFDVQNCRISKDGEVRAS